VSTTVADARFAKPLDTALVRRLAQNHEVLFTVEKAPLEVSAPMCFILPPGTGSWIEGSEFAHLTLPDRFIEQDAPERMYESAGLDANSIVAIVLATLGRGQDTAAMIA